MTGTLRSDRYGKPLNMVVHSFNDAPMKDLPPIGDLMGAVPNLTGGLSIGEYLEDFD